MNILLVNPAHLSIGSRMPKEHLPPLGLLSIGGPLIDAGHHVSLLDADYHNHSVATVVEQIIDCNPDAILLGHSGSTSAQPIIDKITLGVRTKKPEILTIVGGVYPTYHWKEILEKQHQIDYIVCGEGEEIAVELIAGIEGRKDIQTVRGIALREGETAIKSARPPFLKTLTLLELGGS